MHMILVGVSLMRMIVVRVMFVRMIGVNVISMLVVGFRASRSGGFDGSSRRLGLP
jgi:hypothetical protein